MFKLARRMRVLAQPSLSVCVSRSLARKPFAAAQSQQLIDRRQTSEIRSCRALTAEAEVGADDAAEAVDENVSKAKAALQRRRKAITTTACFDRRVRISLTLCASVCVCVRVCQCVRVRVGELQMQSKRLSIGCAYANAIAKVSGNGNGNVNFGAGQ